MRVVIVTGTDTGVGKTVTTAALGRIALDRGLAVTVVKPVQTGVSAGQPADVATVERLGGCSNLSELIRLDDPLAPDTAARRRGLAIPPVEELAARAMAAATGSDLLLIEGAGGVAVRLDTDGGTLLGLCAALTKGGAGVRVVVVTRLMLGTLNATELTVRAVRSDGHELAGLVVGAVPAVLGLAEQSNLTELPRVTGLPLLGAIPAGVGEWEPSRFRAACSQWIPDPDWLLRPTG